LDFLIEGLAVYEQAVAFYRRAWEHVKEQPKVAGPGSFFYQQLGRYCRAIACVATHPFAVPVGVTAEVTGIAPKFVGRYLGELVSNDVLRVVRPGGPGRYTRYEFVAARRL
jgi:hypothetical protein